MTNDDMEQQRQSEQELGAMLGRLVNEPIQQHVDTRVVASVSIVKGQLEHALDELSSIKTKLNTDAREFSRWARGADNDEGGFRDWVSEVREEFRATDKAREDSFKWSKAAQSERQVDASATKAVLKRHELLLIFMLVLTALNTIGVVMLLHLTQLGG